MPPALLTPEDLAAHLRVSVRTVARMVDDGCPSILAGRRRRFDLATVTQWMQGRAIECRSDRTPKDAGTPRLAFDAADFTAASRRVQLRAMPSASKPS